MRPAQDLAEEAFREYVDRISYVDLGALGLGQIVPGCGEVIEVGEPLGGKVLVKLHVEGWLPAFDLVMTVRHSGGDGDAPAP